MSDASNAAMQAPLVVDRNMVRLAKHFQVTPIGLTIKGKPDIEVCGNFGIVVTTFVKGSNFTAGDFANYVEANFGEEAAQILDAEDWSESTLGVVKAVCKGVPPANRREELTFSHHQIVYAMPIDIQKKWLDLAVAAIEGEGKAWSCARLQKEIKAAGEGKPTVPAYYVIVEVKGLDGQEELVRQLSSLGHSLNVKTQTGSKVLKEDK